MNKKEDFLRCVVAIFFVLILLFGSIAIVFLYTAQKGF